MNRTERFIYKDDFPLLRKKFHGEKMHQTTTPNTPASGGVYTPYFYQRGLYLWYSMPAKRQPAGQQGGAYAMYDFSSDLFRSKGFERPQSVEQIIARGYLSVPGSDPTTAIISDRRNTTWAGLDDLISQVRGRFDLYARNMYELEQSICETDNALFRQVAEQGCPANQKQKYSATKMTQKLYEQKREERLALWQDISRLKLAMPEAAQNYLAAYRKSYLLDSVRGDGQ